MTPGAGILFTCIDDNTLLLGLRSEGIPGEGTWDTFGGAQEPGETLSETAFREAIEEAGNVPDMRLITTLSNGQFKIFVVDVSLDNKLLWMTKIQLNKKEHQKIEWFRLGTLPQNLYGAIEIIRT